MATRIKSNPSSGAKQRARGTRKVPGVGGLWKLQDRMIEGGGTMLDTAARGRRHFADDLARSKVAGTWEAENMDYLRARHAQHHRHYLDRARTDRPALPNPSEPQSLMESMRARVPEVAVPMLMEIADAYKAQFPEGVFSVSASDLGGKARTTVFVTTSTLPRHLWPNGISHNDPALHKFALEGIYGPDFTLGQAITVEAALGGSVADRRYRSTKVGWRRKTGAPAAIVKHMAAYFAKLRATFDQVYPNGYPAENPSSGAKQRARGTRKFTSGRMSDGEIHAAGTRHMEGARADAAWLRTAGPAEREEAMRAYNVFGYPHELHWQGKGMAEAHRPRLPNPSSGTRQQALAFDAKPLAAKVPPAYLTVCIQDSERFQEDPPTKNAIMVRAKSLREASDLCRAYIGMHGHGYSTWYGGEVFLAGKLVARISYNGRAWAPGRYPTPEIPLDAVLLPTRNPGGAKQRARGTRAFSMRYAVDQANKPGAMHAYAMEMAEVARKAGDKAEHGHYLAQARGVRSEHPGMDDAITTLGLRLLSFRAKLVFEAQRDTARRGSGDTHFVATKLTDPKASAFTHYFEAPAGASADVAAMVEDYNAHSYGEETRTLAEQREIVATRFGKVANPSSGAKQRARNTRGIRGQIDPSMTGWPSDGSHHGWTMTEAAELRAEGRKYPAWDYSGQRVDRGIVKQHAEYMDYARSKRPALPNPSALTLLYFPANAAWAFVYGTDHKSMRPIAMGSYDHFFADRKQAIHAARVQGLSVSRTGEVSIAGKR